jgi:hypothetical protein
MVAINTLGSQQEPAARRRASPFGQGVFIWQLVGVLEM